MVQRFVSVGAVLASLALPVLAAEPMVETLFAHKHWRVDMVGYDDGTLACVGQVSDDDGSESFSVGTFSTGVMRLQFYSSDWQFAGEETADLEVQIDRRAPWTLTAASLVGNSVLFDLPLDEDSARFLMEVSQGNRLYLRNGSGEDVQNYSLAGSKASIGAMFECGDVITAPQDDGNPFN
ncbi:MAG: hypothetical protein Q27BPR15_11145 [Rhodobacter sp. CACIA14H1]|nr:MAG: hypothetical protein Q27BPR15_11145 [Rhodobacter sp. CACIA14H1]